MERGRGAKHAAQNILFVYAFSDCDTTTAMFGMGLVKFVIIFMKNDTPNKLIELFREKRISISLLTWRNVFYSIYMAVRKTIYISINYLRCKKFAKLTAKTKLNLSSLYQRTLQLYYIHSELAIKFKVAWNKSRP